MNKIPLYDFSDKETRKYMPIMSIVDNLVSVVRRNRLEQIPLIKEKLIKEIKKLEGII